MLGLYFHLQVPMEKQKATCSLTQKCAKGNTNPFIYFPGFEFMGLFFFFFQSSLKIVIKL